MENQHKEITGYRDLSREEIDLMNRIKEVGEEVGELIANMQTAIALEGGIQPDGRWVAIGKTHLQEGFMFLVRAVAKPTTF